MLYPPNSLVHLLCALWHHEPLFQDVDTLQEVENIELLELQKFGRDKPVSTIDIQYTQ